MSYLNSHLFKINPNKTDTPNCACSRTVETVKHFFFNCPQYVQPRTELEISLGNLIPNFVHSNMSTKLAIMLSGLDLNQEVGLAVAEAVQKYVRDTQRF